MNHRKDIFINYNNKKTIQVLKAWDKKIVILHKVILRELKKLSNSKILKRSQSDILIQKRMENLLKNKVLWDQSKWINTKT